MITKDLAADDPFFLPGFVCCRCGRLFRSATACPHCGSIDGRAPVADPVDAAIRVALDQGATVAYVRDDCGSSSPLNAVLRCAVLPESMN